MYSRSAKVPLAKFYSLHNGIVFVFQSSPNCSRMFRAVKTPYQLEVQLKGGTVKVKSLNKNQERGLIERTLARCEEFMAQVFLQEHASQDRLSRLVTHFRNRGWQIQQGAI